MKTYVRRTAGVGAALALIAGLLLASPPAHARQQPVKSVDITGYKISDVVVSNTTCKNLLFKTSIKKKKPTMTHFEAAVDLTHNGDKVNDATVVGLNSLYEKMYFCPSEHGLGKYTLGPAAVYATYEYFDVADQTTYEQGLNYYDNSKTSFYVRGAVKSSLSAKRHGSKVTLTAKASRYAPEKDRQVQYNPKNAKLQVKSGKKWKTVKTLKLTHGKASATLKSKSKKTYRVSIPKSSYAVAKTTASIRK